MKGIGLNASDPSFVYRASKEIRSYVERGDVVVSRENRVNFC